MDRQPGDLLLDTKGHCFLCSDKILLELDSGYLPASLTVSHSTYSIQCLYRYVGMNLGEALGGGGGGESMEEGALAKVGKARLKVCLCEGCAAVNEEFSELYRQLRGIELRMASSLSRIQGRLEKKGRRGGDEVVEGLRREAKRKCQRKLRQSPPRVEVRDLAEEPKPTDMGGRLTDVNFNPDPNLCVEDQIPNRNRSYLPKQLIDQEGKKSSFTFVKKSQVQEKYSVVFAGSSVSSNSNPPQPPSPEEMDDHGDMDGFLHEVELSSNEPVAGEGETENEPNDGDSSAVVKQEVTMEEEEENEGGDDEETSTTEGIEPPEQVTEPGAKKGAAVYTIDTLTGRFKCTGCEKEFAHPKSCRNHYKTIHLKLRWKCKLCGKEVNRQDSYLTHYRMVHQKVRYTCDGCGKLFCMKKLLTKHIKMHCPGREREEEPGPKTVFLCNTCGKTFQSAYSLKKHVGKFHPDPE